MPSVVRRGLLAKAAILLAAPLSAFGQEPKIRRLGFLGTRSRSTASSPDIYYDAFVHGMRDLGYVEGTNLAIEWRFAEGNYERLAGHAAQLAGMEVEVLVTHNTEAALALQKATRKIPIVFIGLTDPVGSGLVASLARPGENVTGLSGMINELSTKQVELLKGSIPSISRVGVLLNPGSSVHPQIFKRIQEAAKRLGMEALAIKAQSSEEIDRGFAAMVRAKAQAVIIPSDSFFVGQRRQIADQALKSGLPSMFQYGEDAAAGGLMSYGPNNADIYRQSAAYVDKILKGARPNALPIEQPRRFELVVNLKTARSLKLSVPQAVLVRADKVIE